MMVLAHVFMDLLERLHLSTFLGESWVGNSMLFTFHWEHLDD